MVRRIFIIQLAILLLICNVGVPVYTHICHTLGKSWSSVFRPAKSCCTRQTQKGQVSICHFPTDSTRLSKGLCCENQQEIVQLNVDYLQHSIGKEKHEPAPDFQARFAIAGLEDLAFSIINCQLIRAHGPPGKLHGRSMLIAQQTFRC